VQVKLRASHPAHANVKIEVSQGITC